MVLHMSYHAKLARFIEKRGFRDISMFLLLYPDHKPANPLDLHQQREGQFFRSLIMRDSLRSIASRYKPKHHPDEVYELTWGGCQLLRHRRQPSVMPSW